MADQTVKIANLPDSGSSQRIAFELMELIANAEYSPYGEKRPEKPREYYLTLYAECRKLTY